MPFTPSFGRLEDGPSAEAATAAAPFRIAVLGDFGGRGAQGEDASPEEFAERKKAKVQIDKLDAVLASFQITLQLADVDGKDVELSIASLDDFHPDQIHEKLDKFALLRGDDAKAKLMAAILHHPTFQAFESAWRGLDWLLRRAQKGGAKVEAVIYDITQDELAASLNAGDDLTECAVYQTLIEKATQGPKGQPWSLIVGLYTFDITGRDAQTLGRMGKIARQANAAFLAGANRRILEASFAPGGDAATSWTALRKLPEAAYVGLAAPQFLLRLPYGENTQSTERFSFEEFPQFKKKVGYLWGNAALACAALLAQSFARDGWGFKPGALLDLDGMALHAYTEEDEEESTLAEAWLLRPAAEKVLKHGVMPLLGVKGRNAMQLYRFTSLAQPPKDQPVSDLAGRWAQKGMAKPAKSAAPGPMSVSAQIGPGKTPKKAELAEPPEEEAPTEAAPAAEAPAEEAPAEDALDPELAALMKQLEGGEPAAAEKPAEEPPAEDALDPELAALMKQLEGGS